MIRVLYISDTLKQRFGVTSVILNYISHFPKDKIKVDLLVYEDSEKEVIETLNKLGSNVFFMPKLSLKGLKNYKQFINNFFTKNKYDIVHSHFNQVDSIIFPIARKNDVKLCISHSHNTKLSDFPLKAVRNRLLCMNIYKNADICAACSEAAGLSLYGKNFSKSMKKLLIHNAIDCSKFEYNVKYRNEIRNELNIKDGDILIGNIGSFKLQKNQTFLIDIFYELLKVSQKYKLLLVGDGDTKESIIKKVNELGLKDNVIFLGVRKDVFKILSALDLFVLPSLYEGLPVIGIEAQASGLNCVFSDTITKEVDFTNIKFISLNESPKIWAKEIEKIKIGHNKNYIKSIKDNGYDISIESEKLVEKYINVINKRI